MIQLKTLGDATITVGQHEVRPTSPSVFAALLYLGVERGKRVPRTALQELLFPDTDERSGAHSLRQLLYKLRQLGASVQTEGDVVWLASEDVSDDYSAPAHSNGNGNGKRHGRTGEFLAGYAPKVSAGFDEWLESRRTAIGVARRRDLIKQMLARRDAADWDSVERLAQEVLAADPFNEEATLALAESTALSGSKAEAIRILENYESETGRSDLKLPASVLRKRISERLPDRRRRPLDTPFVGRDAEAEVMRQAVVRLRAGEGGSIVISGEPGIGKTRLIEETTALALLEGVNVHTVRCQPHYVNRPMGVFIEWVPQLLQSRGALGVAPETLESLTLLTSHKDERAHRSPDARDDATRAGVLLSAVRDLVDAVAGEAPILLVVEDAHWGDTTSLRELSVVLERRRSASVLATYSTRTLDPIREAGAYSDSTPLVRLRPLVVTSATSLAKHLLSAAKDAESPEKLDEWCAQVSGGNPLFIQMLCAHFEDTKQAFAIPQSLRSTTLRRIEQLTSESRRALEICALLGRNATLRAIESLTGSGPHEFLRTIQDLEEQGLLRTDGAGVLLSHDLLRECALELVPPLTKRLLHGAVASHLESRYGATLDSSVLWDCAEHWGASGETDRALASVLRCAEHATGMGRAEEAVSFTMRGRQFASTRREHVLVLERIASSARAARKWEVVISTLAEARTLFESEPVKSMPWQLRLLEIEAKFSTRLDAVESISELNECLISPEATTLQRIHSAQLLVRIAHERMDPEMAHSAFHSVEDSIPPSSTDYACRMLPLIYHATFGDLKIARRELEQVISDLARFEIADEFRAARNCGVALANLQDTAAAIELSLRYFQRAQRLGLIEWQYDFATNCCCFYTALNSHTEAEYWYAEAEALRRQLSHSSLSCTHIGSGIDLALQQGDRLKAESRLKLLRSLPIALSDRMEVLFMSCEVRIAQMDPDYLSPQSELSALEKHCASDSLFGVGDSLYIAFGEALRRDGQATKAKAVVSSFLRGRRDAGPVPDSLVRLSS